MRRIIALILAVIVGSVVPWAQPTATTPAVAAPTGPITTHAENQVAAVDGTHTFTLATKAQYAVVFWEGHPTAHVTVAFSSDGTTFGEAYPSGSDPTDNEGTITYGAMQVANDAIAVRVTTDVPLDKLTLQALSEQAATNPTAKVAGTATNSTATNSSTIAASSATNPRANQPNVVSRAQWGCDESIRTWGPLFATVKKVIIHHTDDSNTYTQAQAPGLIRAIYYLHTVTRGWGDIAYNFLIDRFGTIYEGRYSRDSYPANVTPSGDNIDGQGVAGGHTRDWNTGSVGVAVVGTFNTEDVPAAPRDSLTQLTGWLVNRYRINPTGFSTMTSVSLGTSLDTWDIDGHLAYRNTDCPGALFYSTFGTLRQTIANYVGSSVASSTLTVTASPRQMAFGDQVTLSATLSPAYAAASISFATTDGVNLGSATTDASGSARVTVTLPWAGEFDIKASFGGYTLASATTGFTHVSVLNSRSLTDPRALYHPVDPVRILDTRTGNGSAGPIAGGAKVTLPVVGRGPIPASRVSAVVLNVTVTGTATPGDVTVNGSGSPAPLASNLNFVQGQTVANLVLAKPGADGALVFRNGSSGSIHLLADVAGYVLDTDPVPGAVLALTPSRLLDTRDGTGAPAAGALGAGASVDLAVKGRGGVPASGVAAVVLNVTATQPSAAGAVSVYPGGVSQPSVANLNFAAGQTVANLVIAQVGADGTVRLTNGPSGTVQLIADVAGYVLGGAPVAPGGFTPVTQTRILDTRNGTGAPAATIPAGGDLVLQVSGKAGVPAGAAAASLTLTVPNAPVAGFVTVYPQGGTLPGVSNVNFAAATTVSNLAIAKLSSTGAIVLHNGSSTAIDLTVDVSGWVSGGTLPAPGTFVATDPVRLLDTRTNNGYSGRVPAGGDVVLRIAGRGPVPARGAGAVALNITVTNPASAGVVTAFPSGMTVPLASNVNYVAGQTVANMAVVRLGADGSVVLRNSSSGTIDLVADVTGFFVEGTATAPGAAVAVNPARLLDTRTGTGVAAAGAISGGADVVLPIVGASGVPNTGVGAVILNVTVTQPAAPGHITVFPSGGSAPLASNLNFVAGQTVPNLVVAKLGADGSVTLHNGSVGSAQLVVDVAGYILAGTPVALGGLTPLAPTRILDTRDGTGVSAAGRVASGADVVLTIPGLPAGSSAVVLNLTATNAQRDGFLTAFPSGSLTPNSSNVNFAAGTTVPNLVMVAVGRDGRVVLHNGSAGAVHVIADLAGWYS